MYKVLVIGSNGYIGNNLCKFFLNKNVGFIPVDINADRPLDYLDKEVLDEIPNVDACVFLAAVPGIQQCNENPDLVISENVLKPLEFFNHLKKYNVYTIFASSQAAKNPSSSLYAYSKRILEQNLNYKYASVLRFSNVFGGINYQKKTSIIANYLKTLKEEHTLYINGNGEQCRDFIHVSRICDIIYNLLHKFEGRQMMDVCKGFPLDVGSGKQYSINEITKAFVNNDHSIKIKYNENGFVGINKPNDVNINWYNNFFMNLDKKYDIDIIDWINYKFKTGQIQLKGLC